jgi:hypothetical protein
MTWCRKERRFNPRQNPRSMGWRRLMAETQRHIHPFGNQIGDPIVERQHQVQFRILFLQRQQMRQQKTAETAWQLDMHSSLKLRLRRVEPPFRLLHGVQHPLHITPVMPPAR